MRKSRLWIASLIPISITEKQGRLWSDDPRDGSSFCQEFASLRIPRFVDLTPVICRDGECAGIRWADKTRVSVVADRVPDNAREWYPVSCSEAKYEVSKQRRVPGGNVQSRRGHEQTRPTSKKAYDLGAPDYAGLRAFRDGRGEKDVAKVIVKDAGTQTDGDSTRSSSRSTVNETEVDLHYHRIEVGDSRPRLLVRFIRQASNNPEPFDLLLDSGSHVSYIRMRSLTCPARAGYQDGGAAKPTQTALRFGEVTRQKQVRITQQVNEAAMIGSRFSFPLHLNVATTCEDKYVATGLLGAGRASHLAQAAGVFAYKPSGQKYDLAHNRRSAGTLILGRRDWNQYCQSGLRKIPNKLQLSPVHWIVSGSVTLSTPYMQYISPPVNWVVDTGAVQMLLTPSLYMQLVSFIVTAGGQMPNRSPSTMNVIHNCVQSMAYFPPFRVAVGYGADKFELDIPPSQYLGYVDHFSGNCYLKIEYSEVGGLPNTGIIGMIFLENVFTVFDRKNNHVGFCKPRN